MRRAGAMDQLVTLQRFTESSDGIGGKERTWSDFASDPTVWANVEAKSGRESLTDERTKATFVCVFTIYNRDDVSEKDRIVWDGVNYNIRGIQRTGSRSLRLRIEAERGE